MNAMDEDQNENFEQNAENNSDHEGYDGSIGDTELNQMRLVLKEYKEQLIRSRAEMENQRKRMEREMDSARNFAIQEFAVKLLSVKDSMEKGLDSTNTDAINVESLLKGIDATLNLCNDVFRSTGLEEINPDGEVFDPNLHEAMILRQVEDEEPNRVLKVLQKGYTLNGRLIRPARVEVSTDN